MRASTDALPAGRLPGEKPVAVIDIGSNSIRLVIYEGNRRALTVLFNEKVLSGLGKGLARTNRLDGQAVESALQALARFRQLAEHAGVEAIHAIATAAAREATNGPDFVAAAQAALGQPIVILSGQDEARFAAEGVIAGFHRPDGIAGDLGGGSLELVDIRDGGFRDGLTLPLGGLRLRDLSDGDIAKAQSVADSHVGACGLGGQAEGRAFYAVGGTWRNLARLHMEQVGYPLHVMHGYEIATPVMDAFLGAVIKGDVEKLPGIAAVSKSRRPLLSFGAVALRSTIRHLKPSVIVLSALGVREGYLHGLLGEEERARDPLIEAAREFSWLRARAPAHSDELVAFVSRTFATLGVEESENEERLRTAACLLADIGWRAHPDYRGRQSFSMIAHAALQGIDHPGRVFMGLTNYYRHEGGFEPGIIPELEALLDAGLTQRAKLLAALMRVTFPMTAGMPGILEQLRWAQDPRGGFTLVVPQALGALVAEKPVSRLQQFARMVEKTLRLEVR
ncbi:exopolyphosphatase [Aurantimonas sp. Leaf443]|nr:exopolyphosphatase [Aurantimonas sp. Leaf443]